MQLRHSIEITIEDVQNKKRKGSGQKQKQRKVPRSAQ